MARVYIGSVGPGTEIYSLPTTQYTSMNLEDMMNLYTLLQDDWTRLLIQPDEQTGVVDWKFDRSSGIIIV